MFVALTKIFRMRFFFLLYLLSTTTLYSFDYKKEIRTELSKQFGNAANEQSILFDYNHFVQIKGDTFVVPNGYHYVYQLKNGAIQLSHTLMFCVIIFISLHFLEILQEELTRILLLLPEKLIFHMWFRQEELNLKIYQFGLMELSKMMHRII